MVGFVMDGHIFERKIKAQNIVDFAHLTMLNKGLTNRKEGMYHTYME